MALRVHAQEWQSHISKNSRKILGKKNGHKHLNLSTEDLCPKRLHKLAAGAEEENFEQEDMAYTVGGLSLP